MSKFAGQFAIIEHIKNFVKNSGRPWRKRDDGGISEGVAKRIQKKSYERSCRGLDTSSYPPYLKIAEQLQVNNEQIFCAAVFNLTETALNIKRYRNHIAQLLEQSKDNADLTAAQIKTVDAALQKLRASGIE